MRDEAENQVECNFPYVKFRNKDGKACYYREDSDSMIALNRLGLEFHETIVMLKKLGPESINPKVKKEFIGRLKRWRRSVK